MSLRREWYEQKCGLERQRYRMTQIPEWLQVVPPVIRVIAIVAAVSGAGGVGERVIRGQADRACKQFDSFNKYLLSIYNVPIPILDQPSQSSCAYRK